MLDSVYTSATYNSYVATVAEMDLLINSLDGVVDVSKWCALDNEKIKENLILRSVDDFNSFCYSGSLTTGVISPYNMMYPRTGVCYKNGIEIVSTTIPPFILEYISRRCIERLEYDENSSASKGTSSNVKKQKVGSLEQEFFSPLESGSTEIDLTEMPSYAYIKPYLVNSNKSMSFVYR